MKKMIVRLVLLLTVVLSFSSCSDDFLEKTPTNQISISDLKETAGINPAILESTLTGIYTMMYDPGTGGIGGHNDFGQKATDIHTDLLSADMALSKNTYSRFRLIAQLIPTTDYTYTTGNYMHWRYYYRVIRSCNLVISSLGGNDATVSGDNKYTMGQAKALRAYAYFYLSQLYIPEYTEDSKILPIYIDSENPENQAQSTTKEVYDLMIGDLTQAITLLEDYNRGVKYEVNKDVAKALLAYVYASMGTSDANIKAKRLAEQVIASGYPLTTKEQAVGGFNDYTTPSWIWGVDIDPNTGKHLHSWWGQMDIYSYSYAYFGDTKSIDKGLYDAIPSNDVRKSQFLNNPNSGWNLAPFKKFYHPDRILRGTGLYTNEDYLYLRVDEMYLLSAEMSAKENMPVDARKRLKDLLSLRLDSAADYAYIDGLSGQALIDEVYLQTRIELWGEGKSYLAMKRNKATVTRGANHLFETGKSFMYNADELTFEIPQSEIQNNINISR
ncbi:RagB/SusD family nutrient uptake outer membrane protein [Polaribacter tangerinus]|uniref:RagB/SusD family nutrient uptake outer membrane protein n=1 Tax=Polaribacter tangerinus TaxID=1920034 RepID=UPI000B4B421C|nr:RagB/SusD family nutrient uptake outer membrane protein [Polaribacter tangerinus]